MGIGFVIIIHFIALAILSGIVAAISVAVTFFTTKNKEKRKRRIFLSAFLPFQFFFTLYILGVAGSIMVSEIKDVDIGIGDSFYVPINETCEIQMIDIIDNAYLECNDQTVISQVSSILPTESKIFGETEDGKFFCYELNNSELREYSDFLELASKENTPDLELIEIPEYYYNRRNEVAGTAIIIIGVIAFVTTILIMWLTRKLVLKIGKNNCYQQGI